MHLIGGMYVSYAMHQAPCTCIKQAASGIMYHVTCIMYYVVVYHVSRVIYHVSCNLIMSYVSCMYHADRLVKAPVVLPKHQQPQLQQHHVSRLCVLCEWLLSCTMLRLQSNDTDYTYPTLTNLVGANVVGVVCAFRACTPVCLHSSQQQAAVKHITAATVNDPSCVALE